MRRVWIIAHHEYMVNVRRAGFIIMTLMVPFLGLVGLAVAALYGGQASGFLESQLSPELGQIGVVDHLGAFTPILPAYQDRYRLLADEDTGRRAVKVDEIGTLLVIPADYVESGQVIVISKEGGFKAAVLENSDSVRQFLVAHLLRDQVPQALRQRLAKPIVPVLVNLEGSQDESGSGPAGMLLGVMVPYFMGILLIMTIFISSGYLLRGVMEEKTSRVIEIILSSVTARQLLAGKVLGLGALGLTQILVWLFSIIGLSGGATGLLGVAIPLLSRPEVFILCLVYYVLGFLVYAVLMGSVGALGTTQQESQQLASMFSLAAALPLMLGGFMFANPNVLLAKDFLMVPADSADNDDAPGSDG